MKNILNNFKEKKEKFVLAEIEKSNGVLRKTKKVKHKVEIDSAKKGVLVCGSGGTMTRHVLLNYAYNSLKNDGKVIYFTHDEDSISTLKGYIHKVKAFCPTIDIKKMRDIGLKSNYDQNPEIIVGKLEVNPEMDFGAISNILPNRLKAVCDSSINPEITTIVIDDCIYKEINDEFKEVFESLKEKGFGIIIRTKFPLMYRKISHCFNSLIVFSQEDPENELSEYKIMQESKDTTSLRRDINNQTPNEFMIHDSEANKLTKRLKLCYY